MTILVGDLGRGRGEFGVGLTEGLDDLGALARTAGMRETPQHWVREFVEGWADQAVAITPGSDGVDGLVCANGLAERVRQIYARDTAIGAHPQTLRRLFTIDDRHAELSPAALLTLRQGFLAVLRQVCDRGETIAVMPRRLVVVVGYEGQDELTGADLAAAYRRAVDRVLGSPTGVVPLIAQLGFAADASTMMQEVDVLDFG